MINTKNGIVDPETVAEYKEKYLETLREQNLGNLVD